MQGCCTQTDFESKCSLDLDEAVVIDDEQSCIYYLQPPWMHEICSEQSACRLAGKILDTNHELFDSSEAVVYKRTSCFE